MLPTRIEFIGSEHRMNTYRRTLGHISPGRGMSSTDDHGAHVRIASNSRTAGNTQSGEHCELRGTDKNRERKQQGSRMSRKAGGGKEKAGETKSEMLRVLGLTHVILRKGSIGYFSASVGVIQSQVTGT